MTTAHWLFTALRRSAPPVEPLPQRIPGESLKDNPAPKEPAAVRPRGYVPKHRSPVVAKDLTHEPVHLFAACRHRVGELLSYLAAERTYA